MGMFLSYWNPVLYSNPDLHTNFTRQYKKMINETDMEDLLTYFTKHFSEYDVLEQDTMELKKATGFGMKGVEKEDFFFYSGKKIHPMKILTGLLRAKGNLTKASVDMSISRDRLQDYIQNNDKVRAGAETINEMVIDYVEAKLMEKIDAGDRSAMQYWLNTKAIHRGYGTYEQRRRVKSIIADNVSGTAGSGAGSGFEIG